MKFRPALALKRDGVVTDRYKVAFDTREAAQAVLNLPMTRAFIAALANDVDHEGSHAIEGVILEEVQ